MSPGSLFVGWTTVDAQEAAERLAQGSIESGLVACAQVDGPIASVYRWKGEVQRDTEWRVTFKFLEKHLSGLEAWLQDAHPYDTPEWIAWRADRVSPDYLRWAAEIT